jgi:hypothetical protein
VSRARGTSHNQCISNSADRATPRSDSHSRLRTRTPSQRRTSPSRVPFHAPAPSPPRHAERTVHSATAQRSPSNATIRRNPRASVDDPTSQSSPDARKPRDSGGHQRIFAPSSLIGLLPVSWPYPGRGTSMNAASKLTPNALAAHPPAPGPQSPPVHTKSVASRSTFDARKHHAQPSSLRRSPFPRESSIALASHMTARALFQCSYRPVAHSPNRSFPAAGHPWPAPRAPAPADSQRQLPQPNLAATRATCRARRGSS